MTKETCMLVPDDTVFTRNDTLGTIKARRSVRTFTKDDVTDEEIRVLLHAANQAPSAHNQQAWRFIILRSNKKQELAQLVTTQSAAFPKPAAALLRMGAKSIISAPVVIAVVNTGDLIKHGTDLFKVEKEMAHDFFRTMEIQSSAAAVENILLAATSIGLGTVWLGILYLIKGDSSASPRASSWLLFPSVAPPRSAADRRNSRWR